MIKTCLEFDSLYFGICLEFEFCYLGFDEFHFSKRKNCKINPSFVNNK